jgi:hypothetical protein
MLCLQAEGGVINRQSGSQLAITVGAFPSYAITSPEDVAVRIPGALMRAQQTIAPASTALTPVKVFADPGHASLRLAGGDTDLALRSPPAVLLHIELVGDAWVADLGHHVRDQFTGELSPTDSTRDLLENIIAATSGETDGWNGVGRPALLRQVGQPKHSIA